MTREQLIGASLVADLLDFFVIGQVPGLSWFIDIPLICMHLAYAGPKGLTTITELIPVVGTLPIFTVAAFLHPQEK